MSETPKTEPAWPAPVGNAAPVAPVTPVVPDAAPAAAPIEPEPEPEPAVSTVPMKHEFTGQTADVHPDEVLNYQNGGFVKV